MSKQKHINATNISAIQAIRKNTFSVDTLYNGLINGDKMLLSKAITLIESTKKSDQKRGQELIQLCLKTTKKSKRIGITGVPGVGKSSFIEALGSHVATKDNKVAVLAIDPSSTTNHGSILGDKTRMDQLATNPFAFIRPSPNSATLGGVARKTRETIILCEAAGYHTIFIETVGVGQSEIAVHSMVDFFLVLKLAGSGDSLQGIKRGIIEMADAIIIHKADGDRITEAKLAAKEFNSALHFYPPKKNGWSPKVLTASSLTNNGIDTLWELILMYLKEQETNGHLAEKRHDQNKYWLLQTIENKLLHQFYNDPKIVSSLQQEIEMVTNGDISPFMAAEKLLVLFQKP